MKNNENIWIFVDAFPYENHFHTDVYCTPLLRGRTSRSSALPRASFRGMASSWAGRRHRSGRALWVFQCPRTVRLSKWVEVETMWSSKCWKSTRPDRNQGLKEDTFGKIYIVFHVFSGFPSFSGLTWWYMIGSVMIWKWIVISHLRVAGLLRKVFAIRSEPTRAPNSMVGLDPQARNWTHAKSLNSTGWWFSTLNTRSIPQNHSQIILDPNGPLNRDHFFQENSVLAPDRFLYFSRHGPWKMLRGRCLSSPEMIAKCRGSFALW